MTPPDATLAGRLLVLMHTLRDAERTQLFLRDANVPTTICADMSELCCELRAGAGALLLTEEALAQDTSGQLALVLQAQPAWSALPVLVLAREAGERPSRARTDLLESMVLVERPVRSRTLVSVVLSALRGRRHQYQIRDAILLRERQAAELIAQKERLRFALYAGGLGSWELELESAELSCSDLCKAHFGRTPDDAFSYRDLQESLHPLDRQRVNDAVERSVSTGADYDEEFRVIWPNREERWLMTRGRALFDESGRALRMAGVSLDVTERRRMHEALRESRLELAHHAEELLSANQRKDEFLATLAHELRNPLAPIRTGMDLLAQSPEEPARAQTLGVMRRQISHMVRLIDDLLDVSRITRGKLELKRERVSLASVISSAIEASRPLIERKQHTLQVAVSDSSLVFDADHTRIAQVIGNLLNNASNYTPAGGRIELSAEREGEWAVIQVRDNGIGIPRDRLEDVFEMFSQVNRTLERSQGGLGIGLALVRSLVAMHGGTVRAESAGADLGSTFTVRLPLAASAVQQAPAAESAEPPAERSRRILVVDDNEDAADLLRLVLEQAGYLTQTAYDGPSALTMVESFRPQIVILDIGLPGMSGYEVARALRQDARFAALALIALTGWGTPGDKQKAQEAGFDLHLTKPVDARGLNGALSQLEDKAAAAPFQQTG
ncbi:MAG TPA: ATP-binding protein [Polyangiaceae bacterium]|jgi:signal transduction histidine kinase/ActR/RegA family two-component response regulator|nr:ATP-binding protein [Polyangiaceae bacterium]